MPILTFEAFYDPDPEKLFLILDATKNSIMDEDAEKLGMVYFKKSDYWWLPHPRSMDDLSLFQAVVEDEGYKYEYEPLKDLKGKPRDLSELVFDGLRLCPEAEKLARALIIDNHPSLATAKILYVTKDYEAKPDQWGKVTWAYAQKVNVLAGWLSGYDLMVTFCWEVWKQLNNFERKALTDHELCHFALNNGRWAIRPHNVEEFTDIIARHGDWAGSLRRLETAKKSHKGTKDIEDLAPNIDRIKAPEETPGV
jgi:Putative phage metallopeptidase